MPLVKLVKAIVAPDSLTAVAVATKVCPEQLVATGDEKAYVAEHCPGSFDSVTGAQPVSVNEIQFADTPTTTVNEHELKFPETSIPKQLIVRLSPGLRATKLPDGVSQNRIGAG